MERLTEQAESPVEDVFPRPPEQRVRRRLIQSTLFPHRSQDDEKDLERDGEGEGSGACEGDESEEEEEECCGSQGSRKKKKKKKADTRKRKGKALPQPRACRKVAANVKESQCRRVDDTDFPATINTRSPRQSWEKRRVKTIPTKNVTACGLKHISTNPSQSERLLQVIPDLRLEAKVTAEENSRMFAGRQIHPFFSSRKAGKRYQEVAEAETNGCSVERMTKALPLGPIHVFERAQDDVVLFDWGNWIFHETNVINTTFDIECAVNAFENSVQSLHLDNFQNVSPPTGKSLVQDEVFLVDQCSVQHKSLHHIFQPLSARLANDQMASYLFKDEMDCLINNVGFFSGHDGLVKYSDVEQQRAFLQERMMSQYLSGSNRPEDSLWSNKYMPERAMEVCGNGESVKFLNEWLHLWHERGSHSGKNSACGDKCIMKDINYDCHASDLDSENTDEDDGVKNVLLVTGPVGSGKSAAIYACALEQGFQVLELNTSDLRNGALVKLRIGEALESHSLKWLLENSMGPLRKQSSSTATQEVSSKVAELVNLSDENSLGFIGTSRDFMCMGNKIPCDLDDKILILFEDVDITFCEDRGLITAIQQLAETAKQPMILTSNKHYLALPDNLKRLQVSFAIPSLKELLFHIHMVCAAEKVNIPSHLIEQFIKCCQGDIRKTLMHLQFWCHHRIEEKLHRTYSPLLFDLDAGHRILPKLISCDITSQLSKLVEDEISKALFVKAENCSLMEMVDEEELINEEMQDDLEVHNNGTNSIDAKKEAMLSRNYDVHEAYGCTAQFEDASEFSHSSGSPVAFTRRNFRRKFGTVLSSDSEDDLFINRSPVVVNHLSVDINNDVLLNAGEKFPSDCPSTQNCPNPFADNLFHSEGMKLVEIHHQCMEATNGYICKSIDVSCVPESSFVPETEINDGQELLCRSICFGHGADIGEAVSMSNNVIQNCNSVEDNNLDISMPGLHRNSEMMEITCDINGIIREEVGDSQNEHAEAVPKGYQMMDECSRMDFNRKSKSIKNPRSCVASDPIQETWRRLRECHTDLRKHVTSAEKDALLTVDLAYAMSNLISATDMLLSNCQFLLCDYLEPPMVLCEESHLFCSYDSQLQMASTVAQHGFCFYAKNIAGLQPDPHSECGLDLISEMLTSTTNTIALGKLTEQSVRISSPSNAESSLELGSPKVGTSFKCEIAPSLQSVLQSLVPSRSCLGLKGVAIHEYLSSLGQISRSEVSRLSESMNKINKRRSRFARHYLSDGAMMSPADISLLGQYQSYGKSSFPSLDIT